MRREERLKGGFAMAGAMAILLALVAGGGCELVVSDALPSYSCMTGIAGSCPAGQICVPATRQCVPVASTCTVATDCDAGSRCDTRLLTCVAATTGAGDDGSTDDGAVPGDATLDTSLAEDATSEATLPDAHVADASLPETGDQTPDASPDVSRPCRGLTCDCSGPSACDSGICGGELTVTTALYNANRSMNFCTQPCCSSADCPGTTVCFGTGVGGSYCVAPGLLGRSGALGEGTGGSTCQTGQDCRSGLCANGACADTCCSSQQPSNACAIGSVCRFAPFPGSGFDVHDTPWCGPPVGTVVNNNPCAVGLDGTCQSGKCGTGRCEAVCRSTADCPTGQSCSYGLAPNAKDIIAGCTSTSGAGADGVACSINADCQSNFCDGTHCIDVCFSDADCKSPWHCAPQQVTVQFGGGSYSILSCVVD
jgi:hypothetical protein